jgi:hypothetical protein
MHHSLHIEIHHSNYLCLYFSFLHTNNQILIFHYVCWRHRCLRGFSLEFGNVQTMSYSLSFFKYVHLFQLRSNDCCWRTRKPMHMIISHYVIYILDYSLYPCLVSSIPSATLNYIQNPPQMYPLRLHEGFVVLYTHTISQSLKEQVNRKPETG